MLPATGGAPAGDQNTEPAVAEETPETWLVVELDSLPGPDLAGPLEGDYAELAPASVGLLGADDAQDAAPPFASASVQEGGEGPVVAGVWNALVDLGMGLVFNVKVMVVRYRPGSVV